ncbi:hypothetical protein PIB30_061162, partial [Stylosanthes scabra]|nr:hypothetical protein [Stylosanthes scabra]
MRDILNDSQVQSDEECIIAMFSSIRDSLVSPVVEWYLSSDFARDMLRLSAFEAIVHDYMGQ